MESVQSDIAKSHRQASSAADHLMASPLLRLPAEMVHQICSVLPNKSLFNLMCTSKFFYRLAQPYLYRDINTDTRGPLRVAKVLLSRPDLARNVRSLSTYAASWIQQPPRETVIALAQHLDLDHDLEIYLHGSGEGPFHLGYSLVLLLLNALPNLERLILTMEHFFRFVGPAPVLPRLRELNLKYVWKDRGSNTEPDGWDMGFGDGEWLQEAIPNLRTLGTDGIFMRTSQLDLFPALTTVTLTGHGWIDRNHISSIRIQHLVLGQGKEMCNRAFDFVRDCTQLTSITCTPGIKGFSRSHAKDLVDLVLHSIYDFIDSIVNPAVPLAPWILRLLLKRRETLREIRLRRAPWTEEEHPGLIGSFTDFAILEFLRIPASFITKRRPSAGAVLDIFPGSLRKLVIFKDCDAILPQLIPLVDGGGTAVYPKLEMLKIQIPMDPPQGTALLSRVPDEILEVNPCFGELEEVCRRKGVDYCVVPARGNDATEPIGH